MWDTLRLAAMSVVASSFLGASPVQAAPFERSVDGDLAGGKGDGVFLKAGGLLGPAREVERG